jgi:hypothetical protein
VKDHLDNSKLQPTSSIVHMDVIDLLLGMELRLSAGCRGGPRFVLGCVILIYLLLLKLKNLKRPPAGQEGSAN